MLHTKRFHFLIARAPSWPIEIEIGLSRRPSRVVGKHYFKPEICELNRASAGIEYDTHWQLKARSSTQLHSLDMKTSVRRSTRLAS